tara:strand:- start:2108 stop:2356 length:249 start_codon:yes stop_codon:yes gene_type:complete
MTQQIILNSIRTPDGTVLVSAHEHDFVRHIDANGLKYAIDGGNEILRRMCAGPYIELSEYAGETIDRVVKRHEKDLKKLSDM